MIFHITAQHDHLTCWGVKARREGNSAESQKQMGKWMEGNEKVKVPAAYVNNPAHRIFAIIEANDYNDVNTFTNQFKDAGSCDVQVVGEAIAKRKTAGKWGQ